MPKSGYKQTEEHKTKILNKLKGRPSPRKGTGKFHTKEDKLVNGRERVRKCKFGVPLGWYDKKFAEQGGVCAICGKPSKVYEGEILRGLHIDHNHETGQTRSLLCSNCNVTLGMIHEDKSILDKMKNYLDYWDKQPKQGTFWK